MPSYIPKETYSSFDGGMRPWPAHMTPQSKMSPDLDASISNLALPTVVNMGDVFFLTLDRRDRVSIATTIELLIGALDAMDDDCDLEPSIGGWLGGGTAHGDREADFIAWNGEAGFADDEPIYGSQNTHGDDSQDQSYWSAGLNDRFSDECEDACEDEGGCIQSQPHDDSQLSGQDCEPSSGWTEGVDQTRNGSSVGTIHDEAEPSLGFVGFGRGWREGEGLDDREDDDELEIEHDSWLGCEDDMPAFYKGSGGKQMAERQLSRIGAA